MKTASKVFIILSMLYGAYTLITGAVALMDAFIYAEETLYILGLLSGGFSFVSGFVTVIVGALALLKLKHATSKGETIAMAIITLIFCSPAAGICMLLIKESDFNSNNPYGTNSSM